jgi:hypothetical protein
MRMLEETGELDQDGDAHITREEFESGLLADRSGAANAAAERAAAARIAADEVDSLSYALSIVTEEEDQKAGYAEEIVYVDGHEDDESIRDYEDSSLVKWELAGSMRPTTGTELVSEALSEALQEKSEFTHAEFDEFEVKDLCADSFVQVGDMFFRPVATTEFLLRYGDVVDTSFRDRSPPMTPPRESLLPPTVIVRAAPSVMAPVVNAFRLLVELMRISRPEVTVMAAALSASVAQFRSLWALREDISESQGAKGPTIKHDIALPIARIPAFIEATGAAIARHFPALRLVVFGHLGDGNLHYNLSPPAGGMDRAAFAAREAPLNRLVHDAVHEAGGSISAEHGLDVLRRDEAARYKTAVERRLMHSLKRAFDPLNLMNPGKLLGSH